MSIPKSGSRRIVVDGTPFRWSVRRTPTYSQGNAWSPLTVAVEHELGGRTLVLVFAGARPDNWMGNPPGIATPAAVATAIRDASAAGWRHDEGGGPLYFGIETGELGKSERSVSPTVRVRSGRAKWEEWQPYDPEWLVVLAARQYPELSWLPDALRACTRVLPRSRLYVYFEDPHSPAWRFDRNLRLESEEHGELVLDVLEDQRIGGLEFLSRV